MITAEGCSARRKRLLQNLGSMPDYIVLAVPRHITWLTGYCPNPFSYASQNAESLLILEPNGASTLILDNVQRRLANNAHVDEILIAPWYDGKRSSTARIPGIQQFALGFLAARNPRILGVDAGVSSVLCHGRETIAHDGILLHLSRAKDPDEIAILEQSMRAMESGYAAAGNGIRAGMTELQAFTLVQQASTESAGYPVQIYGDFASGPRTESGCGGPTDRVIQPGDLFLMDFSVVINGYRGDLCSTWVIDGEPTPRQKEMERACLEAMAAGEALLKPGMPCREVDSAVRGVFARHGLTENFRHHTGHGVGLGHPDPPYIVPESTESLAVGDVVTLEPGCYLKGVGGMRFEHNYLITPTGSRHLSNHNLGL